MTELQAGSLRCFPVRYPRFVMAAGIESLRTRPTGRTSMDPRVISFGRNFAQDRPGGHGHGAIDVFAGFGCLVMATVSGRVVEEWITGGGRRPGVGFRPYDGGGNEGGHYVMIQDANGLHHYYAHMRHPPLVQIGDEVAAGTLLGYVGATGLPSSHVQHLHYQVTLRRGRLQNVNPYNELRRLAEQLGATVTPGGFVTLGLFAESTGARASGDPLRTAR